MYKRQEDSTPEAFTKAVLDGSRPQILDQIAKHLETKDIEYDDRN